MEKRPVPQSAAESERGTPEVVTRRLRHQFDNSYTGSSGEVNSKPSQTVPDQSLTIQELLLNHTRGIQSEVADREGEYFEDLVIPQVSDITDLVQFRRDLEIQLKEVEDEIKKNTGSSVDADSDNSPDSGEGREGETPPEKGVKE